VNNLTIIGEEKQQASFNGSTLINGSTVSIPLQTDLMQQLFDYFKFWQRNGGGNRYY
jgi:hypothetical protein